MIHRPHHPFFFRGLAVAATLAIVPTLPADHGRDYLLVQDYHVPDPWHGSVQGGFEWRDLGDEEEYGFEPGVVLGVLPRVSFSLATHFSGSAYDDWEYSSVTPAIQFQITPPDSDFPIRVAVMAGYEFAEDNGHDSGHTHESGHAHTTAPAPKPVKKKTVATAAPAAAATAAPSVFAAPTTPAPAVDLGPDAPPPADPGGGTPPAHDHSSHNHGSNARSSHSHDTASSHDHPTGDESLAEDLMAHGHSGIHAHGTSGFRARLIIEGDLSDSTRLAANLINVIPEDGDTAWGYAVGLRHAFNHDLAIGLEAMGDFESDGSHELLGGVYWSPIHPLMLKLGVGSGLTSSSPDLSVRAGCVWRF